MESGWKRVGLKGEAMATAEITVHDFDRQLIHYDHDGFSPALKATVRYGLELKEGYPGNRGWVLMDFHQALVVWIRLAVPCVELFDPSLIVDLETSLSISVDDGWRNNKRSKWTDQF